MKAYGYQWIRARPAHCVVNEVLKNRLVKLAKMAAGNNEDMNKALSIVISIKLYFIIANVEMWMSAQFENQIGREGKVCASAYSLMAHEIYAKSQIEKRVPKRAEGNEWRKRGTACIETSSSMVSEAKLASIGDYEAYSVKRRWRALYHSCEEESYAAFISSRPSQCISRALYKEVASCAWHETILSRKSISVKGAVEI